MKVQKRQLKGPTMLLALLVFFQSCTVYKSTSITMDQAIQKESKVKVKTQSGEILKFKRVGFENGNYYGVKITKGEVVKIPFEEKRIAAVNEKDKTLSIIMTIGLPIFIIIGSAFIFQDSFEWGSGSVFPPGTTF